MSPVRVQRRRTRARVTSPAVAAANHWRLAVDVHQANHETTYMRLHDGDLPELLAPDIGALLGIPAPATRPLARPKWSPRSFNSGEEEGSIYCPACNWTTSGHESPCDNAWFEHATEAHPERPIQ